MDYVVSGHHAEHDQEEDSFVVHLEGFEGPLDLLLQLAKTQKVDLARISILQLVKQYLEIIDSAKRIRLELAADWLVMAAWLAWLKSCLLLPEKPTDTEEAEQAIDVLHERLEALQQINRVAQWMQNRPLWGQEVFGRGEFEDLTAIDSSGILLDMPRFINAYLTMRRRQAKKREWSVKRRPYWTVKDALNRLRRLLGKDDMPGWQFLEVFLPIFTSETILSPEEKRRQWKAALSGTLLAGLELAKIGQVQLNQTEQFGQIMLKVQSSE